MSPSSEQKQVAVYRDKIIKEICYALGVSRNGVMSRLIGPLFRFPVNRLARIAVRADNVVSSEGLGGGARRILPDLSLAPSVRGADDIPADGPLLVVSNHPGGFDSIAILSCIPRKDLKVILSDVPFTRAFTAARQYFIYVPPDVPGSTATLRASLDHLKRGGALLTFAYGDVEPDPELSEQHGLAEEILVGKLGGHAEALFEVLGELNGALMWRSFLTSLTGQPGTVQEISPRIWESRRILMRHTRSLTIRY